MTRNLIRRRVGWIRVKQEFIWPYVLYEQEQAADFSSFT